ncbi:hypothetical protein [Lactiplantibacillus plantarum]|uniref:hypothetical protein n=1 Tax=Lactiplantibacillus plantarum TaxID=1590 RepID=UPI003BA220D4
MPTINSRACVVNGTPVDKVFSNGNQVYGRNLLKGTSNLQDYTLSGAHWQSGSQSSNSKTISIPGTPGKSYTYSAIVKTATFNCYPEIEFYDSNKKWISNSTPYPMTGIGVRKITAVAPANTAFLVVLIVLQNPPDSQTVVFNSEKLESGSIATTWTPAPEDILK